MRIALPAVNHRSVAARCTVLCTTIQWPVRESVVDCVCLSVSDAELLMRLMRDVDIPAQLLNLIDHMLQTPRVTQVTTFHWFSRALFNLSV